MGCTGIRNSGYAVCLYIISLRQKLSALVSHGFHINTFIGSIRISIINPEEGTDLHLVPRTNYSSNLVSGYEYHLAGSKLLACFITQIRIGKVFRSDTMAMLVLPDK
jgi:hypothetical protein